MTPRTLGKQRSLLLTDRPNSTTLSQGHRLLIIGSFITTTDANFKTSVTADGANTGGPREGVFAFLMTDVTFVYRLCVPGDQRNYF